MGDVPMELQRYAGVSIGDRVAHTDGTIGHVDRIENWGDDLVIAGVRALTPNNEPSAVVSGYDIRNLSVVPDNVIPLPRSDAWWAQAREFCAAIEAALSDLVDTQPTD